ncbi:hypothetical protein Tco_0784600 [Tanacetum coccineum]
MNDPNITMEEYIRLEEEKSSKSCYYGMLLFLIINLYVSYGIPFDPKRYYKDGSLTNVAEAKASPATTTTTTSVTNAQLKALIDKGVADALAARDADRSMNGDDSHNSGMGVRRNKPVVRECTYQDFMKCQPLNFKGHDVMYAMTWADLKKMMTDKYSPRGEIKKLEVELWNLKVKDKIERYVSGLPAIIHESVVASNLRECKRQLKWSYTFALPLLKHIIHHEGL